MSRSFEHAYFHCNREAEHRRHRVGVELGKEVFGGYGRVMGNVRNATIARLVHVFRDAEDAVVETAGIIDVKTPLQGLPVWGDSAIENDAIGL